MGSYEYLFIQRYLIERKTVDAISWDTVGAVNVNDTSHVNSFIDAPFATDTISEELALQYRVHIEDKQGIAGKPFEFAEITVASPKMRKTVITTSLNKTKFILNDTLIVDASLVNPTRKISTVKWFEKFLQLLSLPSP